MPRLFTDNAKSTLAAAIAAGDLTLTVGAGHGARFPSPSGGDYFMVTLEDTAGTTREIVKVTARAGDVLTIVRAQEGTVAAGFGSGDKVELRSTALHLHRRPFTPYQLEYNDGALRQGYVLLGDWPPDSVSTASLGTSTTWYDIFQLSTEITLAEVGIEVSTAAAGATLRLGLARCDHKGQPVALVAEFGVLDCSTLGIKAVTGLSTVLTPGRYCWLVNSNATGCSVRAWRSPSPWLQRLVGTSPHIFNPSRARADAAFPATPDPWNTMTALASFQRLVFVRLSAVGD